MTPRDHLEWLFRAPPTNRLERWMQRRSVQLTLAWAAFVVIALLLMTAHQWGPIVDGAIESVCR